MPNKNMPNNRIQCRNVLTDNESRRIGEFAGRHRVPGVAGFAKTGVPGALSSMAPFLRDAFAADLVMDQDIVAGFVRDSSNLPGRADALCRPQSERALAAIFRLCFSCGIPFTVCGGRSALTGSATTESGVVISMVEMLAPPITVDVERKTAQAPVGMILEDMRRAVIEQSNNKLYFPVDPTSRADACVEGRTDEKSAFLNAVRSPINAQPLRRIIGRSDKVAVVVPDITRPFPSRRILPWFFSELAHVRADNFTIIIGTGSHRPCAPAELAEILGAEIVARYRIVNHNAHDLQTMLPVGRRADGGTLYLNKEYTTADRRIIMGFIEPHFMAGFSGGYKAVMPGVADINSILYYHRPSVVAHPQSTWGMLEHNPTQELIREFGSRAPVDFCVNVTLNQKRGITGVFCGEVMAAHLKGCALAGESAMVRCARRFPVVITTNGGYPLDQNLYQSVKGISAAAQIVDDGGLIIAVCECADSGKIHRRPSCRMGR